MKKINWLLLVFLMCIFACKKNTQNSIAGIETDKKPNIIFLFSDDQSFKAVHALGNKEIKTPTMDKLAEDVKLGARLIKELDINPAFKYITT